MASLGDSFAPTLDSARQGNSLAFEALWHSYAPAVSGYLRLQGASDPDGLTNEVFLGVFRGLGGFAGDEPGFRAWLFTIAHRRLTDDRRRQGRQLPVMVAPNLAGWVTPVPDSTFGNPEAATARRAEDGRVHELCSRLAPDQCEVLLLRLLGGLTIEEIATTVGKTEGAVKALQRRGLNALRKELSREKEVSREGVPL